MSHDAAIPLLHDYLTVSASRLPDKVALVAAARRLTYAEADAASSRLAWALCERGVVRGDRVVIFGDNSPETVIAFWAVLKASAVVVVVSPLTKADKLAYYLRDSRASALVTDAHLARVYGEAARGSSHLRTVIASGAADAARLDGLPGAVGWEAAIAAAPAGGPPPRRSIDIDLAAIIYTSGSTGDPKGVMLTHRNMLTAATSIAAYLEIVEDDVILGVLPLSFDYGLYQMIMAFRLGARLVLERSFNYPAQVLETAVRERVTGFPGVPTMFAVLAEMKSLATFDLSNIRYVTNTAAALPGKHITLLRRLLPQAQIFSMYGLTECKRCTYLPPRDLDRKPGSVGIAIPDTELWIVDDQDHRVGPGQVGQLVIRGATVMRGYWEKPEATAEKLRPGPLPGEYVLYTGDYCRLDDDGYLYFVGRMDDIIKSRGEKVAPKEVEGALYNIAGVKDAAVIGVPDELLGEAVKAFVVLEEGARLDQDAIRRECQRQLENFMVPKHIEIVAALPRTSSDKISKKELKAAAAASAPPATDETSDVATSARAAAEALARGRQRFLDSDLLVEPGALVPRAETELLARTAIELLEQHGGLTAIDMGCGAGNLACALAHALPQLRVFASDVLPEAAALTRKNVDQLGFGDRVVVSQGDLFAPLAGHQLEGAVDVVVCNPPYISSRRLDQESAALLEHEPRAAFDGGPFGFRVHQRVINEAQPLLKVGGYLVFEVGLGQERQVAGLLERSGAFEDPQLRLDEKGRPRVVLAKKR